MTLTIEVSGELEAALKAKAHQQGLTADRVAHRVLAQALAPCVRREEGGSFGRTCDHRRRKSPRFCHWAKSHRDTPPLSDEAVSSVTTPHDLDRLID